MQRAGGKTKDMKRDYQEGHSAPSLPFILYISPECGRVAQMCCLLCLACLSQSDSIFCPCLFFFFFKVHSVSIATEDTAETAKEVMKRVNRKRGRTVTAK